jgi:hypothetical protein
LLSSRRRHPISTEERGMQHDAHVRAWRLSNLALRMILWNAGQVIKLNTAA